MTILDCIRRQTCPVCWTDAHPLHVGINLPQTHGTWLLICLRCKVVWDVQPDRLGMHHIPTTLGKIYTHQFLTDAANPLRVIRDDYADLANKPPSWRHEYR